MDGRESAPSYRLELYLCGAHVSILAGAEFDEAKWKQIYYGLPYNTPGTGALDIPRITDWRNWRDAVYPAFEEMGFNLKKLAFS